MRTPLPTHRTPTRRFVLRPISLAVCLLGTAPASFGLPQDGVPSFGQTTVRQTAPNQLDITQGTQRAGIDWRSFSIGANERVVVTQPGRDSVLLNRVLGNDPSQIFGNLQSNGSVWLINPRGIVFGANSRVDVGSLLASTLSITNDDIASGRIVLGRGAGTPGELVSEGQITAPGGSVILVAPQLTHSGRIDARRVGLAAATEVAVDVEGDGLIFFNARNDGSLATRLSLLGNVFADGGLAEVRAAARAGFADTVLNLDGIVQARSIGQRHGQVIIDGGRDGATLLSGRIDVSGSAAGESGGDARVLGQHVGLLSTAVIDASGAAGGGSVRIGGDYQGRNAELPNSAAVIVQPGAQIHADATGAGDGGRVIVWADHATRFQGSISAQGGALGGDGGFTEVSGRDYLDFRGQVDLRADKGRRGTLLLDPLTLTIQAGGANVDGVGGGPTDFGDVGAIFTVGTAQGLRFNDFAAVNSVITATSVSDQLKLSNVELQAKDTISVTASISPGATGTFDLTLRAGAGISITNNADITSNGALTLSANDRSANANSSAAAFVTLASGSNLSAGTTLTITNNKDIAPSATGVHLLGGNLTATQLVIVGDAQLTANPTWTVSGSGASASVIAGAIGQNAAHALVKGGAGVLELGGTNTYTGGTQVNAGTLRLSSNSAAGTGDILVGANTLDVTNGAVIGNVVTIGNNGTLTNSSGAGTLGPNATAITLPNNASITLSSTGTGLTVNRDILETSGGATEDVKIGGGTVTLSGANTYTGGTTFTGSGTLRLADSAGAGTGTIVLGANTLDITNGAVVANVVTLANGASITNSSGLGTLDTGATPITLTSGATITVASTGGGLTVNRRLLDGAATESVVVGSGSVTLAGNNTYDGGSTVQAGATLKLGSATGAGTGAITLAGAGSVLDVAGQTVTNGVTISSTNTGLTSSSGAGTLSAATLALADGFNLNLSSGASASLAVSGVISDGAGNNSSVTVTGGSVTLGSVNTYNGGTSITGGTLTLGATNGINGALIVDGGGTLNVGTFDVALASLSLRDGAINGSSGRVSSTADYDLRKGSVGAILDGPSGLSKTTVDTVTLSRANTYVGNTLVTAGTLVAANALALGTTAGTTAVTANATLEINNVNIAGEALSLAGSGVAGVGALVGTGAGAAAGGVVTLTGNTAIGGAGNLAIGNAIGGAFDLTKVGAGTLTLNAANGYTGTTQVSAGTLAVGIDNAFGGALVVDGGTLALGTRSLSVSSVSLRDGGITGSTGTLTSAATFDLRKGSVGAILAGSAGATKTTADEVTLGKANTYTGTTTVSAGTLTATANGVFTGALVVDGGTLALGTSDVSVSSASLRDGSITGSTGTLTSAATFDLRKGSVSAILAGGVGATKSTADEVTLGKANTYTGTTTVSAGTLTATANGVFTGALVVDGGTLALGASDVSVSSASLRDGSITGSTGTLTSASTFDLRKGSVGAILAGNAGASKTTVDTVTLSGNNTYTGTTSISAGTLALGANERLANTSLIAVSGTGSLDLGTFTETVAGVQLAGGSIVNGTLASSSAFDLQSGSASAALAGSAGANKTGAGTVTLSGNNTYTGTTSISAGTLALGANERLANTGLVAVSGTGILDLGTFSETVAGAQLAGGSIVNGTLTSNSAFDLQSGSASAVLAGSAGANKTGVGTVTLSGNNTYTGTTNVSAGTLALGASERLANTSLVAVSGTGILDLGGFSETVAGVQLAGGSIGNGTLTSSAAFDLQSGSASAILAGSAGANKTGGGTVTLSGNNTYTGTTSISAGTLALGANERLANTSLIAVSGTGSLDLGTFSETVAGVQLAGGSIVNGTLTSGSTFDLRAGSVGAVLDGSTGLTKTTAGSVTLNTATTYTGTTTVGGGTLTATVDNAFAGALIVDGGGTLALGTQLLSVSSASLRDGAITGSTGTLTSTSNFDLRKGSISAILAGAVGADKTTVDSVTLSGANTYTGATTVSGGTLVAANALALGSAASGTTVTSGGALEIANVGIGSEAVSVAGTGVGGAGALLGSGAAAAVDSVLLTANTAIGGSGSLLVGTLSENAAGRALDKVGSGTLTLNASSHTGGTTVSAGTLALGANGSVGGDVTVAGGAFAIGAFNTTLNSLVLQSGAVTGSTGQLQSAADFDLRSGTVSARLAGASALVKTTAGSVTLSGANSYTGTTTVSGGTLALGANDVLPGAVVVAGGTLDIGTRSDTVSGLSLQSGGAVAGSSGVLTSTSTYDMQAGTVSARLAGSVGLTKSGVGSVTLSGANTYTGTTAVNAGTLALGADDVLPGAVVVAGGTLAIGTRNDTVSSLSLQSGALTGSTGVLTSTSDFDVQSGTLGARLAGSVGLTKTGSASITLTGPNSYTGTTTVSAGTLVLGAANVLPNAIVVSGGTLDTGSNNNASTSLTLVSGTITGSSGVLSSSSAFDVRSGSIDAVLGGSSGLVKTTAGTVTLSQQNTYVGATSVAAGTLALASSERLANGTAVDVGSSGTLSLAGNETVGTLTLAGALSGTGTLTAGSYTLNGGSVGVALGTGTLNSNGNNSLAGTAAASAVNVNAGSTLTLGGPGLLTNTPAITVAATGTLQLGGDTSAASLALAGTLGGSGTLSAGTYTLSSGTANAALGAGVLTSSGSSAVNNTVGASAIAVTGGTLTTGGANLMSDSAAVTVNSGATLTIGGSDTVGTLALSGRLAQNGTLPVVHTLTASSYTLNGGTVDARLGSGTLTSAGNSSASASLGAGSVTVGSGTLSLLAPDLLAAAAIVTIDTPATLQLAGDNTVTSLVARGRLSGSGKLTALDYTLDGALVDANLGTGALVSRNTSRLNGTSDAGDVVVDTGQLTLGSGNRLADTASVTVRSGTTLVLNGNDSVGALDLSGTLNGGGLWSLTAANTLLNSGTYDSPTGSGNLISRGTSTLNGVWTSGSVLVDTGVLTLGNANRLTALTDLSVKPGAQLTLGGNDTAASLVLQGLLTGSGTLTAASYALNGGTANAALGLGVLNVNGGGTLGAASAAATVNVNTGTLTLVGGNRLADNAVVTVATPATLALGGNDSIGQLLLSGQLAGSGTLTAPIYTVSGGSVGAGLGAGAFTSSGNSTVTGSVDATSISVGGGTLTTVGDNRLGDTTAVTVASGATLALGGTDTVGSLALAGRLAGSGTLSAATIALNGGLVDAALGTGALSSSGASQLNGSAAVASLQVLDGQLTLGSAGRFSAAPVTTVLTGATLALGGNETLGTLSGSGAVALGAATLSTGNASDTTFDGVIGGSGNLVKLGSGRFTLAGSNTYTGNTAVNAGTLVLATPERLADGSTLSLANGATLSLSSGTETVASATLAGTVDGSGTLAAGNTALNGATVTANLGGGSLVVGGNSTLAGTSAASTVAVNAGTLTLASANRLADGAQVTVATGAALQLTGNDTVAQLTLAGTLAGSGTLSAATVLLQGGLASADLGGGTLTSTGASRLDGRSAATTLAVDSGTLTLGSAARLSAAPAATLTGTLVLGGAETLGTLAGTGTLVLGSAVLTTGNAASSTFSGVISGAGELVKQGSGSFTMATDQAYTGRTTVTDGTLAVAGTLASASVAVNGGTLALQSTERLADSATLAVASGATVTLAGDERVASLALSGTLGGAGTLNALSYTLAGGTANADLGAGTLDSTGSSRVNGRAAAGTVNVNGGTLTLGSAGRFTGAPSAQVAGGAALVLGGNETLGRLSGGGNVDLGAATLSTGSTGASTFSGVIGGSGGLVKQGAGTFTLAGNNTYSGGSSVQGGTLALTGSNTLADSGSVTVATGATLALGGNETVASLTLSGLLTGSGTLTAATTTLNAGQADAALGSGVLVSSGSSQLNGTAAVTTLQIDGGTLTLGAAGRFSAAPAATVAGGATLALAGNETLGTLAGSGSVALGSATLATGSGGTSTFDGVIAGSGGLVKQGPGTFTLAGSNSYTGTTRVDAGTLALLGNDRLADASAVTVASGATLALAGNDTVASLLLRGVLGGSGTLTAASTTLDSGTANANLGTGSLVSLGNSLLAGTSAAGTVDIQAGTLTLAAADRLANAAAVSVANGATLTLGGNDTVATLLLQGTLSGSGRLSATTTTLAGGTVLADLGNGALVSTGASTLTGGSLADTLLVSSGTLTLASAGRLQAAPAVSVNSGATLALGGNETIGSLADGVAGGGSVSLGAATLASGSSGADTSFAGAVNGSGGLTKQGSGNFTLAGANTYTGLTRIDAGTLTIGNGASGGSIAGSTIVVDGVLRSARADSVNFGQAISGSGAFEQAGSGSVTLQGGNKTYSGETRVLSGALVTLGSEQLPDASGLRVATGATLALGGDETLRSVDALGTVALGGNLTTTGAMALTGAVSVGGGLSVTLKGQQIDAVNTGNDFGSGRLSIDAGGAVTLDSGSNAGQRRDLVLGSVNAAAGGTVSAGIIGLQGDVTVSGGTLALVSSAPALPTTPDAALLGKISPAQRQIAFAGDVVTQAAGTRIDVAETAGLQVIAENGGSVQLLGRALGNDPTLAPLNSFRGSLEVRSGGAFSAWAGNQVPYDSHVQIGGTTVRVGGAGIEADIVAIRADRLSSAPGAVITARMPFDNLAGTTNALPALTLELTDAAFLTSFPFGQNGGNEIAINVGSKAWGNRTSPLDSGYITVLPRNGARGATAVVLSGPPVGGYNFYFDGAGVQTEIPVFYNGVLPVTPQVSGSISATVAVSEGARKERFDEAVRTENVAVRLRSGVIAEVGPGRPATVGTEGARSPAACTPTAGSLACEAPRIQP